MFFALAVVFEPSTQSCVHSLSEAGRKQLGGRDCNAGFVPGGFFTSGCPNIRRIWLSAKSAQPAKAGGGFTSGCAWKSTGGVHDVCMRGVD